jgi:subtilisin family serine protease
MTLPAQAMVSHRKLPTAMRFDSQMIAMPRLRARRALLCALLALHGWAWLAGHPPHHAPLPWLGVAWADDDGDDGDSDDGGSSAGASGGDGGGQEPDLGRPDPPPLAEGETYWPDELLALDPSPAALQRAQRWGARVIERQPLNRLGRQLVRLRLPPGLDARTAREIAEERDPGVFDLHRLYRLDQAPDTPACTRADCAPAAGASVPGGPVEPQRCGAGQRIGMVDTEPAVQAPVLRGAALRTRRFVEPGRVPADAAHGTAVAAVLVGQAGGGYAGLVPRAQVLAAAPFFQLPSGSTVADAAGLIRSLDWLVEQGARVAGLSLSGPPSGPLQGAVARAQARGVLVVAAAGNGGRNAPPAHPAALDGVLGATAVSADRRVYWRAGQGEHVDYALPGVDLPLPDASGQRVARSGTSYAVPHLVAVVSQSLHEGVLAPADWLEGSRVPVQDLGSRGRDPVFGWGLPVATVRCP